MNKCLSRNQREAVEAWLKAWGYWYPPDAVNAVYEGRLEYHSLDPTVRYPTERVELPIRRAIQQAQKAGWSPPRQRA